MSRFVVTGATGFVGGWLTQSLLKAGHEVVALVRDGEAPAGCDVIRGELEDLRTCVRLVTCEPDGVFHLAAQAIVGVGVRDPFSTFESNVRGTYNLLEACRRHVGDTPIVVASSDKAYGHLTIDDGTPDSIAYREGDRLDGRSPYDCSKSCTDMIARSYAETYSMNLAIVRAGNIYGPGDTNRSRIVPSIIDDIRWGRPLTIRSDGTPVRDYLCVADAVSGYLKLYGWLAKLASSGQPLWSGEAFNLSGGEPASVLELVDMMAEEAAVVVPSHRLKDIVVLGTRGEHEIPTQVLDSSKARSALGWSPQTTLRAGLAETIRYEFASSVL